MMRIALFGAAPDTPNMGVSALFASTIAGIRKHIPDAEFIVFDNGLGLRRCSHNVSAGEPVDIYRYGARPGRRYYRQENLKVIRRLSGLGKVGHFLNKAIRLIDSVDVVLDVSGGDSFSDIYGIQRFENIVTPKIVARNRNVPLILLPQTYGPYKDKNVLACASDVTASAEMAWARDIPSFEILKTLLGDHYDPERHKCGVDMAFGLQPRDAQNEIGGQLSSWISGDKTDGPLVGFNISGLILNSPEAAAKQYGFKADYQEIVLQFLDWILEQGCRLVLIPHVMDPEGHFESDIDAAYKIRNLLPEKYRTRIEVSGTDLDQCQVKWLISKMDWFCGTRMHATIAGLSSGVPTASIAYSDKTIGVFESCGQGEHVADPRSMDTEGVILKLKSSFAVREETSRSLAKNLPDVLKVADDQIALIARHILAISQSELKAGTR